MSKSTVVPSVPSAKVLARIHDENEDRNDQLSAKALDELSPHARAAVERILGTPKDPDYMSSLLGEK